MNGIQKIHQAHLLLDKNLPSINNISIREQTKTLIISLRSGENLYIRYNDYNEYSYTLIFSDVELDRFRFDNLDKNWEVESNPHHYHPRKIMNAFKSPMTSDPDKDIPLLCDLIRKNILNDGFYRF